MKKSVKKQQKAVTKFDIQTLKHWKSVSTKGKLQWLESAMRFAKLKKF